MKWRDELPRIIAENHARRLALAPLRAKWDAEAEFKRNARRKLASRLAEIELSPEERVYLNEYLS
jgi:hypothetical protein